MKYAIFHSNLSHLITCLDPPWSCLSEHPADRLSEPQTEWCITLLDGGSQGGATSDETNNLINHTKSPQCVTNILPKHNTSSRLSWLPVGVFIIFSKFLSHPPGANKFIPFPIPLYQFGFVCKYCRQIFEWYRSILTPKRQMMDTERLLYSVF